MATSKKGTNGIYQRIPGHHLSPFVGKQPQSISLLKLPPSPKDPSFAKSSGADMRTTRFDTALQKYPFGTNAFRVVSWAKWETIPLPRYTTLEEALDRVESLNGSTPRMLKAKLNFTDGRHLLFERANWADANSLVSKEIFTPHGYCDEVLEKSTTRRAPTNLTPIADERGRLLNRPRTPGGTPVVNSFAAATPLLPPVGTATSITSKQPLSYGFPPEPPGSHGWSFTPLGYNSAAVRPSVDAAGVRRGCRETSPKSFQTIRADLAGHADYVRLAASTSTRR